MNGRVLVVDDEPRLGQAIKKALERSGHEVAVHTDARAALAAFAEQPADVVVSDWRMPGMDGIELLGELLALAPELPVILVTAYGDVPSAVAAMRAGAFDYLTKPFDNDELRGLVARALELSALRRENQSLRRALSSHEVIAESRAMREVLDLVDRVASADAPVLILGESGSGKEVVARRLHLHSERVCGPFVAVNCKAFAEGVLESELFGHEKGAFTGATSGRAGCFERAAGGTLFLDEIGEVDVGFQAKLLRVLQEGEVQRVGGAEPRAVDVRVVAATNRELRAEIAAGRFREDLFFRLSVLPVSLPPLRERRDDVLPLARHFVERYARGRSLALGPEARSRLAQHPWPGNVRELENAVQRAVILARSDTIGPEDLLLDAGASQATPTAGGTLHDCLEQATKARVESALAAHAGRRSDAAEELGVDRSTLYRLMKRLGIEG